MGAYAGAAAPPGDGKAACNRAGNQVDSEQKPKRTSGTARKEEADDNKR